MSDMTIQRRLFPASRYSPAWILILVSSDLFCGSPFSAALPMVTSPQITPPLSIAIMFVVTLPMTKAPCLK